MLMQNLVLAAVATLVFYHFNKTQGWYFLTDVQFALIFVGIALSMSLIERFHGFSTRQEVKEFAQKMGLVDNELVEEAVPDVNGKLVEPCYNTPFKVIRTQYGDRGLLAGYNEMVEAYQQGGLNNPNPRHNIYLECMAEGGHIEAKEEVVAGSK